MQPCDDSPGWTFHLRKKAALVLAALTISGVVLSACASQDENGSPAQRMRSWESASGFGGDASTLRADVKTVVKVERDKEGPKILRGVCAALLDDAETANGELPTPDTKVTDLLSAAYDNLGSAANACYDGEVTRTDRYRAEGTTELSEAQARIDSITASR